MSADIYIRGIIEPNEEFKKKYAAFVACEEADIDPPEELWEYFNEERPNPSGLTIDIEPISVRIDEYNIAYEIDLKSIRSDVSKIQISME